jgi:hypothetical protein
MAWIVSTTLDCSSYEAQQWRPTANYNSSQQSIHLIRGVLLTLELSVCGGKTITHTLALVYGVCAPARQG